jgi:hypothetical protein
MRRLWRRFCAWWNEPITLEIHVTKSPDWDGDAEQYRHERGWE